MVECPDCEGLISVEYYVAEKTCPLCRAAVVVTAEAMQLSVDMNNNEENELDVLEPPEGETQDEYFYAVFLDE